MFSNIVVLKKIVRDSTLKGLIKVFVTISYIKFIIKLHNYAFTVILIVKYCFPHLPTNYNNLFKYHAFYNTVYFNSNLYNKF